MIQVEENV